MGDVVVLYASGYGAGSATRREEEDGPDLPVSRQ